MKLTNKLGLPSSIVNAIARDPYTKGDAHISVTTLVGPARKRVLELVHGDELTEDVSDRIWSLLGQLAHSILERHDADGWTEERLFMTRHGWRISGQFDRVLVEGELIQDYKLTSTYSIKDGVKPEHEAQINLLRELLKERNVVISRGQIVAILRDWQRSKARHDPSYPQAPVVVMDVPLWSADRVDAYILARLTAHADAQHVLPLCTPDERWERPAKFALVKEGNMKATSLHDTLLDAEMQREREIAADMAKRLAKRKTPPKEPLTPVAYRIDERPADSIRCKDYCAAAAVCQQWKAIDPTIRMGGQDIFEPRRAAGSNAAETVNPN